MKRKPATTKTKKNRIAPELQRTSEKIRAFTSNAAPDSSARVLSAVDTQSRLVLSIEALEAQPSEAGKGRKGYKAPLRVAIERICSELDTPDRESVLQRLEDEDYIEDLYGSRSNPIDIHAIEVLRDTKQVSFTQRNGRQETRNFKTMENYIAMYKSSHPE